MSDNNNVLLAGALVVGFFMMNRRQAAPVYAQQPQQQLPNSMPGNVGNGWQQMAQGAVAGLLSSIAFGPRNNTPFTSLPSYGDPVDAIRGGITQEAVAGSSWDGYGYVNFNTPLEVTWG